MVSFVCDNCQDTVKKPKLDQHYNRCRSAFTCVDCYTTFGNHEWTGHTACISEAQKVQGKLYRGPKSTAAAPTPAKKQEEVAKTPVEPKKEASKKRSRDEATPEPKESESEKPSAKKPKMAEDSASEAEKQDLSALYQHLKVKRLVKKALKKADKKTMERAALHSSVLQQLRTAIEADLSSMVDTAISTFSVNGDSVSLKKHK